MESQGIFQIHPKESRFFAVRPAEGGAGSVAALRFFPFPRRDSRESLRGPQPSHFQSFSATCAAKMQDFQKSKRLRLRLEILSSPRLRPEIPQDFRRRVPFVEKRQFFDDPSGGNPSFP